jgi:hypothetical protein
MLLKLRNVIASSSAGDEAEDEQPDTYSDHHVPIWDREARCKPWDHRKHCRPEIQKAFFLWYHENEQRFAIKLKLLRCTDRMLEIGFCLVAPVVTAWLTRTEIEIVVNWEDTFWDFLRCFETFPKRVTGGYVCDQCPKDSRPTFPSRYGLSYNGSMMTLRILLLCRYPGAPIRQPGRSSLSTKANEDVDGSHQLAAV